MLPPVNHVTFKINSFWTSFRVTEKLQRQHKCSPWRFTQLPGRSRRRTCLRVSAPVMGGDCARSCRLYSGITGFCCLLVCCLSCQSFLFLPESSPLYPIAYRILLAFNLLIFLINKFRFLTSQELGTMSNSLSTSTRCSFFPTKGRTQVVTSLFSALRCLQTLTGSVPGWHGHRPVHGGRAEGLHAAGHCVMGERVALSRLQGSHGREIMLGVKGHCAK